MLNPLLDLIQAEIDGENTPLASQELHAILEENEEARILYSDLANAAAAVRLLPVSEPPPDLKNNIMQRIAPQPVGARVPIHTWRTAIAEFFAARPQWAIAYAVVAGIVIGGGVMGLAGGTLTVDSRSGLGTMAAGSSANTTYQELVQFRGGAVAGSYEVEVNADLVTISHNLSGAGTRVQIVFDAEDYVLVEPFHSSGTISVTYLGDRVTVDQETSKFERLVLRRLDAEATLGLQVLQDGRPVLSRAITPGLP
jgi:hypothetical protein